MAGSGVRFLRPISPAVQVTPLVVGGSHVEASWRFLCPRGSEESVEASFLRVYEVLIGDLLPGFGDPRRVILQSVDGEADLADLPVSDAERAEILMGSIPVDLVREATVYLNVHLQTASGHHEVWGSIADVSLEPDDLGRGIALSVDVEGTVYQPPGPDADQVSLRQYQYNGPRLVVFLRSLRTALGAVLVGRNSTEIGPEGYLAPRADQTGLPSP